MVEQVAVDPDGSIESRAVKILWAQPYVHSGPVVE